MKEITFLKKNAEKWNEFEALLDKKDKDDPDRLSELFLELTDDLSYSRTFFPSSTTTNYLNQLTAKVHRKIYRNKKERSGRLVDFWKRELPLLFKKSHKQLFYSFITFAIAILIGAISAANDDTFVRLILGDTYVNQTLENIEKGDPMAVYKKMNEMDMFLGITINNIKVSFFAFMAGIIFSFGSIYILFTNGIMLGAFQYFFHEHDLLYESMLTIWIHGTLEISAIVIAGCAGIIMGNSILFPGTYPKGTSFINGAKQGLKIVIGLVPIFITAGFLEGFVTRHTEMPAYLSLLIISGSMAFIIWYFIIYPIRLNKKITHETS